MALCLFTPTFLPKIGGVEMVVSALAKQMCALGESPCVVTQWPRAGKGTPADHLLPYPVVRYRRPWSFSLPFGLSGLTRALERAYTASRFDVIHAHLIYPVGTVAVEFGRKHNIPVVLTPHGSDIRPTSRYRRNPLVWRRIVQSIRSADAVTAINGEMHRLLAEILGDDRKIIDIPNGVDIDELTQPTVRRDDWTLRTRGRYVLYLGGLNEKKGVDVLIRAIDRLHRTDRNGFSVVIAGDGPMRSTLQRVVSENDLATSVEFTGLVTGEMKRYLLQHCDYVVMPSRTEAMPLVALESYACGKPIVATRVGGLTELVQDGVTGRLVPPENPEALANAMFDLMGRPLETMADAARSRVQQYNWTVIAKGYQSVYRQLVATGHVDATRIWPAMPTPKSAYETLTTTDEPVLVN